MPKTCLILTTFFQLDVPTTSHRDFCPACRVLKADHDQQSTRGERRSSDGRQPLLRLDLDNLVWPPLHLLEGAVNKLLEKMDDTPRHRLLECANVQTSWRSQGLLAGRPSQELLRYVARNPSAVANADHRAVLHCLFAVSDYARARGADASAAGIVRLRSTLARMSAHWRAAGLPTTPKLHVFEQHLADFIERHAHWGRLGEQCIEAMHKVGVAADGRCVGANSIGGLDFFFKHQLAVTLADRTRLEQLSRKMAESTANRDAYDELQLFNGRQEESRAHIWDEEARIFSEVQ